MRNTVNNRSLIIYSISCLFFIFSSSTHSQNLRTNYDVLSSILDSNFIRLYDSAFANIDTVKLEILENQFSPFLTERAVLAFNSRGVVFASSPNKFILKLGLENAKTEYPQIISNPFFGDKRIMRQLTAKGFLILSNREINYPLYAHSFNEKYIDTIFSNEKERVENTQFDFLKSTVPAESLLRSLVEQFSAIAITTAIVYLFFKVRSK